MKNYAKKQENKEIKYVVDINIGNNFWFNESYFSELVDAKKFMKKSYKNVVNDKRISLEVKIRLREIKYKVINEILVKEKK